MAADIGQQIVTLKYFDVANTGEVNARHKDIRQVGLYQGGYLSIVDNTHASISPLVCEIDDGSHQVKVETQIAVTIAVAVATPYLILRWTYTGSATADYMELLAVATPTTNDVIVGLCTFTGGGALQGFDYGDSDYPRTVPDVHNLFLKVEPAEGTSLHVGIRAGRVQNAGQVFDIPDQVSSLFTAPGANSKVYLVYVNIATGAIAIDSSGTEAASPVAPDYDGRLVLAEVTLASTDTNITASMIKDVRSFLSAPAIPDGSTIELDATGKLSVNYNSSDFDETGGELSLKDNWQDGIFGAWTNLDSLGSVLARDSVYKAGSDGFIFASTLIRTTIFGYTDGANPPTVERIHTSAGYGGGVGITLAVKKNDYWKITNANNYPTTIQWLPIGSGTCVKQ